MYRIRLKKSGVVLAAGFPTLAAADAWHENWLDDLAQHGVDTEDDDYRVIFEPEKVSF